MIAAYVSGHGFGHSTRVAEVLRALRARAPRVPEYEILVAEMPRYVACAPISNGRLRAGRLHEALEAVLAQPQPAPPVLDGAERAAARLLERVA